MVMRRLRMKRRRVRETWRISNSRSEGMCWLGLLWTGAREGGESAAGTSAFDRMIYVHGSATKCRNKISAQSEMNFVDCWLIVLVSPRLCYNRRQRGEIRLERLHFQGYLKTQNGKRALLETEVWIWQGLAKSPRRVYRSRHACKMVS